MYGSSKRARVRFARSRGEFKSCLRYVRPYVATNEFLKINAQYIYVLYRLLSILLRKPSCGVVGNGSWKADCNGRLLGLEEYNEPLLRVLT